MLKKMVLMLCCVLAGLGAEAQTAADTVAPVFMYVEQMPEYPGGQAVMYKFIQDNIKYPSEALKNGIEGRVFLKFIVEETGAITNITVMRGSGDSSLDEEAKRVVSVMPQWKPGRQNGRAVKTFYQLPLTFRIDNSKPAPEKN